MTSPENARLEERQHMLTAAIARALCFTGRCHMLDLCGKQRQCCAVMTSVDDVWLEAEALLIALPSTKIPSLTGQLSTDLASARAEIEQLKQEHHERLKLQSLNWHTETKALRATVKALRSAVEPISRMKVYPDDTVNRFTLVAAIELAHQALAASADIGG